MLVALSLGQAIGTLSFVLYLVAIARALDIGRRLRCTQNNSERGSGRASARSLRGAGDGHGCAALHFSVSSTTSSIRTAQAGESYA